MKRTKLLALTLVVAIMMMGAGYAYWSEVLTIGATVDTGELDVIFVDPTNNDNESYYQPNSDAHPEEDAHFMNVTFNDVYPGAKTDLIFNMENIGTIGAYVDGFKIVENDYTDGANTTNKITDVILCSDVEVEGVTSSYSGRTLQHALNYLNNLDGKKGIFLDQKSGRNADVMEFGGEAKRQVVLSLEFDPAADESSLPEESVNNEPFTFTIEADVLQFNERSLPDENETAE